MTKMVKEMHSEYIEDGRSVEVHVDEFGEYWVGMTLIKNEKDWEFFPREQYGTGEVGLRMAKAAAKGWANGIRFDMAWMAR